MLHQYPPSFALDIIRLLLLLIISMEDTNFSANSKNAEEQNANWKWRILAFCKCVVCTVRHKVLPFRFALLLQKLDYISESKQQMQLSSLMQAVTDASNLLANKANTQRFWCSTLFAANFPHVVIAGNLQQSLINQSGNTHISLVTEGCWPVSRP